MLLLLMLVSGLVIELRVVPCLLHHIHPKVSRNSSRMGLWLQKQFAVAALLHNIHSFDSCFSTLEELINYGSGNLSLYECDVNSTWSSSWHCCADADVFTNRVFIIIKVWIDALAPHRLMRYRKYVLKFIIIMHIKFQSSLLKTFFFFRVYNISAQNNKKTRLHAFMR